MRKILSRFIHLLRSRCKYGTYIDETGKYAPILRTGYLGSDWYQEFVVRFQEDGTCVLKWFSHFRNTPADIPFWENDEWDVLPEPYWSTREVASIPIRSIATITQEEKVQIATQLRANMSAALEVSILGYISH